MVKSTDLISLDFDGQKADLIAFLQANPIFKDYDFSGSNLNVLVDVLAYNSNKQSFLLNMLFAEAFLDSAQLMDSVVSHAKDLNYTPRSARSGKATIQLDFNATGQNQPYLIPKGASFSSLIKNQNFVFSIPDNLIVSSANTSFTATMDIYEGIYLKDSFIYLPNMTNQRFRISNQSVDTDSINVLVYEDNNLKATQYSLATTLLDLDDTSLVYFLQSAEKGYYEVLFGDNNIGRRPKDNSTIVLDYRVAKDDASNGARSFIINFDPTGIHTELIGNPKVTVISPADGGAPAEDIESIRYYAPRHFQAQERAVIPQDYEVILKEEFPEINAVSAYGGEDANPPQYGKVFVTVDLANVDGLPDSKKEIYANFLRKRSAQRVVIQSPQYTYFAVASKVRYNVNSTTSSAKNIQTLIINAIINYSAISLNKFGCEFRDSQFIEAINVADDSVISNITDVLLYKAVTPQVGNASYVLNFGIAIWQNPTLPTDILAASNKHFANETHSVSSSAFTFKGDTVYLKDDGTGILRLVKSDGTYDTKIIDIGFVNYATGQLTINNLTVDAWVGDTIKFYIKPLDEDVIVPKDTIAEIKSSDCIVTVEGIKK